MDKLEVLFDLAKQYGPVTGVALFNLWIYVLNPLRKKRKGSYVSYQTMHTKINTVDEKQDTLTHRLERLEERFTGQVIAAERDGGKIEALATTQMRLDSDMQEMKFMMRDFTATQKTTNRLLGENKDAMRELLSSLREQKKD